MTDHEHAMLQAINGARVDRGIHALAADVQLGQPGEHVMSRTRLYDRVAVFHGYSWGAAGNTTTPAFCAVGILPTPTTM